MKYLAIVVVAATLGVGAFLANAREAERVRKVEEARAAAAARALAAVDRAWDVDRRQLEGQAGLLASNELLRRGIVTDELTINDMVQSEGLRTLRDHPVYAVGHPAVADLPALTLVHGLERISTDELAALPFVREVSRDPEAKPASGLVKDGPRVSLAAAAPLISHDRSVLGYVLVGTMVDDALLARLAEQSQAALVLSDGAAALAKASAFTDLDPMSLASAIGTEGQYVERPMLPAASSEALGARVKALGGGLSLWVVGSAQSEVAAIGAAHAASNATGWGLTLAIGGGLAAALLFAGRHKAGPEASATGSTGSTGTGTQEAPPTAGDSAAWATGQSSSGPPRPVAPGSMPKGPGGVAPTGLTRPGGSGQTMDFQGGPAAPSTGNSDPLLFGRYRLVERLGAGGMAEVWTAVLYGAEGFARPFVVKRIRRDLASNEDLVQQFIDEANLASRLVHGNVVPVFDFGRLGEEYFLAQEYILGRDLGKVVQALAQRGRRLEPGLATYVMAEVAKALDYAHTQHDASGRALGIVHRDVSPNNVLASQRGEVKLIDFGIAKSVGKVAQTEVGTVKGNVRFMAPEQARGESTDPRTDLFSLGVTMFFAMRGEPLYSATNPYELLLAAANGPTAVELDKMRQLPAPLDGVITRLLQPKADDRFPSAAALIEALGPHVPADGARRLSALIAELFAEDLARQQRQFDSAVAATRPGPAPGGPAPSEDATVQRPGLKPPTGET